MKPERKTFEVAEFKATGAADSGTFEAIVAVFDNVDDGGDRIIKGAFEKTLQPPSAGGRGFPPVVWSHLWGIVPIGASMRAEEVTGVKTARGEIEGLLIEGELLVKEHQTAREVYAAMRQKGGDGLPPLREFSFGYQPTKTLKFERDEEFVQATPGHFRDLLEVDLFEVGPTLVGMNPRTELLDVKTALEGVDVRTSPAELRKLLGVDAMTVELRELYLAALAAPDVGKPDEEDGKDGKPETDDHEARAAANDLLAAFPR